MTGGIVTLLIIAVIIIILYKGTIVVPQQTALVIERLGKYYRTIQDNYFFIVPFIDVPRYRHTLKEEAFDIPAQVCITKDNVQVSVDGLLYLKVFEPKLASYGVADYRFAISQLAQRTLRSEIGKISLDKTFEERTTINTNVIEVLDRASAPWGVKVLRYEIKNITPPKDIVQAMEKQMRAERTKRADVLESEGIRDATINKAEGKKQQEIKLAQGKAQAILDVANATAQGLERIAEATQKDGATDAIQLRIAEQYVNEFGKLAKTNNTLVLPANVADIGSMMAVAMKVFAKTNPST